MDSWYVVTPTDEGPHLAVSTHDVTRTLGTYPSEHDLASAMLTDALPDGTPLPYGTVAAWHDQVLTPRPHDVPIAIRYIDILCWYIQRTTQGAARV